MIPFYHQKPLRRQKSITRFNSGATSSGDVGNRGSDNGITTEQVDNSVSLYKYSSTNLTTLLLESGNTSGNETDVDNSIITSMPYHLFVVVSKRIMQLQQFYH